MSPPIIGAIASSHAKHPSAGFLGAPVSLTGRPPGMTRTFPVEEGSEREGLGESPQYSLGAWLTRAGEGGGSGSKG